MSNQDTRTPQSPAIPIAQAVQTLAAAPAAQRKAACKAALRQFLNAKSRLVKVDDVGDFDFYVKALTVGDTEANRKRCAELRKQFGDDPIASELREAALGIFDEEGNLYFDPADDDDMRLLNALPYSIFTRVQIAQLEANGGDALKNLLAAESGS